MPWGLWFWGQHWYNCLVWLLARTALLVSSSHLLPPPCFSKLLSLYLPATKCHQPLCFDPQQLWQKDSWSAAGVYLRISLICLLLNLHSQSSSPCLPLGHEVLPPFPVSCSTTPNPTDLGPNSLVLTQQKKQTLRQPNGGPGPEPAGVDRRAGRGGSPSVSLSPSLSWAPRGLGPRLSCMVGSQKERRWESLFCSN